MQIGNPSHPYTDASNPKDLLLGNGLTRSICGKWAGCTKTGVSVDFNASGFVPRNVGGINIVSWPLVNFSDWMSLQCLYRLQTVESSWKTSHFLHRDSGTDLISLLILLFFLLVGHSLKNFKKFKDDDNDDTDKQTFIVLRLQRHVNSKRTSYSSQCVVDGPSQNICKTEQKARVLSKKLGLQSTAENWQWWQWPNWLRQTVPNRRCSCREGTVADDSTQGAWSVSDQIRLKFGKIVSKKICIDWVGFLYDIVFTR